jgi:hypothetical protein
MNFINRLLGKGCSHRFSWPRVDAEGRHYQRCLQCGIAYEYDWATMRSTGRVIVANVQDVLNPTPILKTHASARPPLLR